MPQFIEDYVSLDPNSFRDVYISNMNPIFNISNRVIYVDKKYEDFIVSKLADGWKYVVMPIFVSSRSNAYKRKAIYVLLLDAFFSAKIGKGNGVLPKQNQYIPLEERIPLLIAQQKTK